MGDDQTSFFQNYFIANVENTTLSLLNNFLPLLKISCHICVSLFLNAFILFLCSLSISLCQYHTVIMTVYIDHDHYSFYGYVLKSSNISPPILFNFIIILVFPHSFHFHTNTRESTCKFIKSVCRNFEGDWWNCINSISQVGENFGTILSLPIVKYGMCLFT